MFGKKKRREELASNVGEKLRLLLASERDKDNGTITNSLKTDSYVLGFHFMMALSLYIVAVNGKTDSEEQGFVILNAVAKALDMDTAEVDKVLNPLASKPNSEFVKGTKDADTAFEKVTSGEESTAFLPFIKQVSNR